MKKTLALLVLTLFVCSSLAFALGRFEKAEYLKGAADQKNGERIKGTLAFDNASKQLSFVDPKGNAVLTVKYDSIKSLLYERTSKPRYAEGLLLAWPLLFTKSKKHYLTVQFADPSGAGQFAIIHLDKSNYQAALAEAEAETGKQVQRTEEH